MSSLKFILAIRSFLSKIKRNKIAAEILFNLRKKTYDNERYSELSDSLNELMKSEEFPLPVEIEIETQNRCNGKCDFCPVNRNSEPREYKLMDEKLFFSIISQLKELNYSGHIAVYSNNEPLMDKRIFDFVSHVKQELPNAKNFLFTNGILLTLEKFKQLIDNLDYMVIDNYYEGEEPILPDNIKEIANFCLQDSNIKQKVRIQLINKHLIRNNRAGNAKNRKISYKIKSACLWPFSQMVIRPTGKVSLCCNDALGEMTMGDLNKEKLIEIWNSDTYKSIREKIISSRKNINLCYKCDSFGLLKRDEVLGAYQIGQKWGEIKPLLK